MKKLFTSESVTEGHPDKVCDQISDAVLDAYLTIDPNCHVACEVSVTNNFVLVMGETNSNAIVDIEDIVRKTILEIGYDKDIYGFNGNTCEILIKLAKQSADISIGVDKALEVKQGESKEDIGAGDQGLMFGYACNETEELMPLPIILAHKLAKRLSYVRHEGILNYLRPDGKTQVTVEYENDKPIRIDTVLVSTQHDEDINQENIKNDIIESVIKPIIPSHLLDNNTKILVNPTGRFVIGGPAGDSGLTGRKIIVDTYGGYARHGGGAFSGKDSTKVDRSAAYFTRYMAKNLVASGITSKCEIQLSYAIGMAKPTSLLVETFNTSKYSDDYIIELINNIWELTPSSIINYLHLNRPMFKPLASYGHMGRIDLNVAWEKTDKVEDIKKYLEKHPS
jgi:S-adenosylmethionine synthetase